MVDAVDGLVEITWNRKQTGRKRDEQQKQLVLGDIEMYLYAFVSFRNEP